MARESILITGVAGLLGGRFSDWLIKNHPEYDIIGIDNLSGGYVENINDSVIFYKRDLNDNISDIFDKHKPSYVYHFAAYAAEGLSPWIRMFNYKTNLVCSANVINNCITHNIKRLIFTSSMSVYGHGEGGVFDENQTPSPIDPYAVSKYATEMDIKIAGDQHGLDWCIIRPHNVYGEGQNIWDKYRNVLGIWMFQRLNNMPMTIFGTGDQTRAFSYIDDILQPLYNAAIFPQASKEIINLGGMYEYTIKDANRILRDIIGGETIYLEQRHEVFYAVPTYQKSIDLLNFKQDTSLEEGLIKMWNWAKKQPKRERFEWSEFEMDKNIYSFWKQK